MKALQKIISIILILLFAFNAGITPLQAEEGIIEMHSLDELPSSTETPTDDTANRAKLLDALDNAQKNEPSEISFTKDINPSTIVLLSEKVSYERDSFVLSPTMRPTMRPNVVGDSLIFPQNSSMNLREEFLALGNTGSNGVDRHSQMGEVDIALPLERSLSIRVKNLVRESREVSTIKGKITVNIATGTIITTASGDIIDTNLIQITSLEASKTLQAKIKYEKRMKNRGNKKKGMGEASVEGFEFGLSGSHLIFSRPVEISIPTPNAGEGIVMDLLTEHAGDSDFHTGGLSVDPATGCSDGLATIPGSQAVVKNGKITFYTCGASSFTMNPSGGTAGSNDLRIIIGDCAQVQIYYNNLTQIYTGNPAATGCGLPGMWAALRIGGTTYGNGVDGVTATAWSTQSTTGSTNGNTYTATSTMTAVVGGLTYTLIIDWAHTAPNKYFTWSYRVIVPPTNAVNIRFYFANDTYIAGGDANDTGYFTNTGGQTIGVYDSVANVLSAYRYLSGAMWTAYEAGTYSTVASRITGGTDFANTYVSSGDLGFGVNWNFGTGANITYSGTVEWRMLPYVSANVPDLVPGIGQPEGPLTTNLQSQIPITVTNAGNLASSGVHTVNLYIPANIIGPTSPFSDNGWACGAQVGTGVTCTKTTTLGVPMGSDIVKIPVTPTLAASGSSITLTGTISNPGDSNITNNTAFAINAVVGGITFSPGGIPGATLWLRAGNGTNCTTTGCTITSWSNSGTLGTGATAVTGLGTVTLDLVNRLNSNPTLYFNSASLNTNSTLNVTTAALSLFTTSKIGGGGTFLMGTQSGTVNGVDWSTSPTLDKLALFGGTTFYNGANSRSPNIPAITSTTRSSTGAAYNRTNSLQTLSNTGVATTFSGNSIGIGRTSGTNASLSNVGEVIVYPTEITGTSRLQIESYLAIKYGITLDQTIATNYLLSNASIAWNATIAGVWKNDIAGIARDDTSTLSQLRSQSVTNTGDIIVTTSSIGTNRMSLLWANDGGQIATFTGVDAPTGFQRISREWFFEEKNGDLGTVTLSYPAASVATGFTAPLMLLADSDGTFAVGSTAYTGTYNTGANSWDFSLNIADLQYISFAKNISTDTTPPLISNPNIASGALIPTGTFSYAFSYVDTGSSINTSSVTMQIYSWNTGSSTWNGTNLAPTYMSTTSITSSTGTFQLTNIPYGKYRFDMIVADSVGNTQIQSTTLFVDAIEWIISSPIYDIGGRQTDIVGFGSGELLITVKTVGAGFDLSMIRTQDLTLGSGSITVWNGTNGWGYDKNIGAGYSGSLSAHNISQTLVSISRNIDQSGQKTTYIYRVKYGVLPSVNDVAGDYTGKLTFGINLTY